MEIQVIVRDETEEALSFGVLIPAEVRRRANGETFVICYPEVEPEVRNALKIIQDPLSENGLRALCEACVPYAASHGTEPEAFDPCFYYRVYEMDVPQMPMMVSNAELRPLGDEDFANLRNVTDFEPDFAEQRIVGVIIEDTIVSVAAENPYAPAGTAELQTMTAEAYRGNGYATACVSALTRLLFAEGVTYICYHAPADNPSSIAVAEKAGFTLGAEYYPILCYIL